MSGIFVLAPVLAVAPVVLAATSAVAANLGFQVMSQKVDEFRSLFADAETSEDIVQFDVAEARGLTQLVREQGAIILDRADATLCFQAGKGRVQLLVRGKGSVPREDLERLGRSVLDGMAQQYAYHMVVSDLKSRGFDKVQEARDEDGTIRLHLRRWD